MRAESVSLIDHDHVRALAGVQTDGLEKMHRKQEEEEARKREHAE